MVTGSGWQRPEPVCGRKREGGRHCPSGFNFSPTPAIPLCRSDTCHFGQVALESLGSRSPCRWTLVVFPPPSSSAFGPCDRALPRGPRPARPPRVHHASRRRSPCPDDSSVRTTPRSGRSSSNTDGASRWSAPAPASSQDVTVHRRPARCRATVRVHDWSDALPRASGDHHVRAVRGSPRRHAQRPRRGRTCRDRRQVSRVPRRVVPAGHDPHDHSRGLVAASPWRQPGLPRGGTAAGAGAPADLGRRRRALPVELRVRRGRLAPAPARQGRESERGHAHCEEAP